MPDSRRWLAFLVSLALLSAAATWAIATRQQQPAVHLVIVARPSAAPPRQAEVSGAVLSPGLYPIRAGDRLADLVEHAGGLSPQADLAAINLAQRVGDGDHLIVPSIRSAGTASSGMVRLNHASREEIMALPGVTVQQAALVLSSIRRQGPILSAAMLNERHLFSREQTDRLESLLDFSP